MRKHLTVEVGQRFQSIGTVSGAPMFTYRVDKLFQSRVDGVEYARLVQVDDPSRCKSVAAAVLLNARQFIPVAAEASDKLESAA
jgi:hypothetical protein